MYTVLLFLSLWELDACFAPLEVLLRSLNSNWLNEIKNLDFHAKYNLVFGSLTAPSSVGSFLWCFLFIFFWDETFLPFPLLPSVRS